GRHKVHSTTAVMLGLREDINESVVVMEFHPGVFLAHSGPTVDAEGDATPVTPFIEFKDTPMAAFQAWLDRGDAIYATVTHLDAQTLESVVVKGVVSDPCFLCGGQMSKDAQKVPPDVNPDHVDRTQHNAHNECVLLCDWRRRSREWVPQSDEYPSEEHAVLLVGAHKLSLLRPADGSDAGEPYVGSMYKMEQYLAWTVYDDTQGAQTTVRQAERNMVRYCVAAHDRMRKQ
ncbi:unnamed protein product, partial [marine sediment metagenome]